MSHTALIERVDRLESESAIRRLVARYFAICDDLGPDTPFEELGQIFASDARWEGKGRYAKAFGEFSGRNAIVAMIRSYCQPAPHFVMTAHFLSAESIHVDGDIASGHWMMLQTSDYTDGSADLRSASLTISFSRKAGVWRIARFLTRNIFSRQVEPWNDEQRIAVPLQQSSGAHR